MTKTMALVCAVMLTACAGRAPAPVQVVQAKDAMMDCNAIQAEIAADATLKTDLSQQKGMKVVQNVSAVVGGLFFFPVWFLMDFQEAAKVELTALESRDAYLATLATLRCKPVAPMPVMADAPLERS